MLFGFELHQQRLDGLSTSDSIYETVLPRPNFRELLRKARSLLRDILACVLDLQPLDRRLHCSLQNSLIQHVRESSQHRLIERLLLELDRIRGAGHAIDEQRVRESLNSFLGPCPQYYNFSYYDGSTCDKY